MRYFVEIHIPTGIIEGYAESNAIDKLNAAYRSESKEICSISLAEGSRYDSDRMNVAVSTDQIIAIKSRFVR